MTHHQRIARTSLYGLLAVALSMSVATATSAKAQRILVDHRTVDASIIPQPALDAARARRMSFSHASVGSNVWWSGLSPLAASDPARYAIPNWRETDRGNPGWRAKYDQFETWVGAHASEYEVFMNKLCFVDWDASFAGYRDSMTALARRHPDEQLVWWTMPIMVDAPDNVQRQAYNRSVRAHCAAHDLPLFDIAAIESHRPDGSAVLVNGVEALAPEYASDNGHLNETGALRAAHALWYLMARLSGWNPSGPDGGGTSHPGTDAAVPPIHPSAIASPEEDARSGASCSHDASMASVAGGSVAIAGLLVYALIRRR